MTDDTTLPILTPDHAPHVPFTDPAAAVARLESLYAEATAFLAGQFSAVVRGGRPATRIRAFYPEIRLTTTSFIKIDSRLSFGHVAGPGTYSTTITRPDLFRNYLHQQIALLIQNHGVPVAIGASETPIPVHFALAGNPAVSVPQEGVLNFSLRDVFDVRISRTTCCSPTTSSMWTSSRHSHAPPSLTALRATHPSWHREIRKSLGRMIQLTC